MKEIALILKFLVIGLIYLVIFRILRIMYLDLKNVNYKKNKKDKKNYALEVNDVPPNLNINQGSIFLIHKVITIGRSNENDIKIDDPYVSAYHAKVYLKDERLYIEDLKSTNGTYINGRRIEGVEEIEDGDVIEIGRVAFKVVE